MVQVQMYVLLLAILATLANFDGCCDAELISAGAQSTSSVAITKIEEHLVLKELILSLCTPSPSEWANTSLILECDSKSRIRLVEPRNHMNEFLLLNLQICYNKSMVNSLEFNMCQKMYEVNQAFFFKASNTCNNTPKCSLAHIRLVQTQQEDCKIAIRALLQQTFARINYICLPSPDVFERKIVKYSTMFLLSCPLKETLYLRMSRLDIKKNSNLTMTFDDSTDCDESFNQTRSLLKNVTSNEVGLECLKLVPLMTYKLCHGRSKCIIRLERLFMDAMLSGGCSLHTFSYWESYLVVDYTCISDENFSHSDLINDDFRESSVTNVRNDSDTINITIYNNRDYDYQALYSQTSQLNGIATASVCYITLISSLTALIILVQLNSPKHWLV